MPLKLGEDETLTVQKEPKVDGVRFWVYWVLAIGTTLFFFFFMTTMLMVPGIRTSAKIWMLIASGASAAISLGSGMWSSGNTDAPATRWPLGPVSAVVLLLELAYCAIGIYSFLLAAHH